MSRGAISAGLRRQLVDADLQTSAHCGIKNVDLVIDHIIPLSLLGADEPGNWAALCKSCNREKWLHLKPGFLRFYRGERIAGPIGARVRDGRLWLKVNGRGRYETRDVWKRLSNRA